MREVFPHPLGPLPLCSTTPEGTPRKTAKAVLAMHPQTSAVLADDLPSNSTFVFDGRSLFQKVRNDLSTLGHITAAIHGMIRNEGFQSNMIGVVLDMYEEMLINNIERSHMGGGGQNKDYSCRTSLWLNLQDNGGDSWSTQTSKQASWGFFNKSGKRRSAQTCYNGNCSS